MFFLYLLVNDVFLAHVSCILIKVVLQIHDKMNFWSDINGLLTSISIETSFAFYHFFREESFIICLILSLYRI